MSDFQTFYNDLGGSDTKKVKRWKTRPQTPKKKLRFTIFGLGPHFRAIWAQNLEKIDFLWFWGILGSFQ